MDGREREELDGSLGIIGLEEDERGNDEGRKYCGEETGLRGVSTANTTREFALTKTRRVSMSSAKSAIMSSS